MVAARKANGQFEKGVSGNPSGRPKKEREDRFLEITLSAVTFKDWRAIIKRAVGQAKKGNSQARKFLADYLIGPPVQKVKTEHSGEMRIVEDVNSEEYKRTVSTLAQALGEIISRESAGRDGNMETKE